MNGKYIYEEIKPTDIIRKMSRRTSTKRRRANLPKRAVDIMSDYVREHVRWAYPSDDEKRSMADRGNITKLQVDNWFINARRRIVPKILKALGENPNEYLAKRHRRSSGTYQTSRESSLSPENSLPMAMYGDHDYEGSAAISTNEVVVENNYHPNGNTGIEITAESDQSPLVYSNYNVSEAEMSNSEAGSSPLNYEYSGTQPYEHDYNIERTDISTTEDSPNSVPDNPTYLWFDILLAAANHIENKDEELPEEEPQPTYHQL